MRRAAEAPANQAATIEALRQEFVITGYFLPYVRMTRRGKWTDPRAQAYLVSQEAVAWQFQEQCKGMLPDRTPLRVTILIKTPAPNRGDVDNLAKALIDSAQGIVFRNDCWISELCVRREYAPEYIAAVVIETI